MIGTSKEAYVKGQTQLFTLQTYPQFFFEAFGMDQIGKSMNATGKSTLKYVKLPSCGEG